MHVNENETTARNTNRGLRSEESKIRRNKNRSIKRNIARNEKRHPAKAFTKAQEPKQCSEKTKQTIIDNNKVRCLRIENNITLKFMNLNIQGMKKTEKRTLIEKYMKLKGIDIAFITETHINTNNKETKKEFT